MAVGAKPVRRGCGTRVAGGVYAECGLGPGGRPVEDFLIDPPIHVNADVRERMGLRPVGVTLAEREVKGRKVTYIFDWVGSEHYATPTDFIEEVRRFGLSRRLPRTLDFSRLTGETRIALLHSRAWLVNALDYFKARGDWKWWCPQAKREHENPANPPSMCASLWWEDAPDGTPVLADYPYKPHLPAHVQPRLVVRRLPSFEYVTLLAPPDVEPQHDLAMFASFPLTRLAVVRDPEGGTHEEALEKARKAKLPVDEVDQ